jgi:hypothetical protein
MILVRVKLVEAFFIAYVEADEHAKSNADAETESIDKRVQLALSNVASGYFQIVVKHWDRGVEGSCFMKVTTGIDFSEKA